MQAIENVLVDDGPSDQLEAASVPISPRELLELLRHVAMGESWESAADHLQLAREDVCAMRDGLDELVSGIYFPDHPEGKVKAFLHSIKPSAWNRLIGYLGNISHAEASRRIENLGPEMVTFKAMAGFSRQLLMWEKPHFMLVGAMIDYYRIPIQFCRVVISNRVYTDTVELARQYIMTRSPRDAVSDWVGGYPSRDDGFQMDPVRDPPTKHHVESRCAISFQRNRVYGIRTSYEFIMLFGVFAVWYVRIRRSG